MENTITIDSLLHTAIEWHLLENDPDSIRTKLHERGVDHPMTEEVMKRLKAYIHHKQTKMGRQLMFMGAALMVVSFPLTMLFSEYQWGYEYALYTSVSIAFCLIMWGMSKVF